MMNSIFNHASTAVNKYLATNKSNIMGHKTYRKITCIESKTYGGELNFYIPKNVLQSLEHAVARINVPAFSGFSGGAYVRYVNNAAIRHAARYELWNNGVCFDTRYPDDIIFSEIYPNLEYQEFEKVKDDIGYGTTSARNTAGGSAQYWSIDLGFIYDIFRNSFPIHLMRDDTPLIFKVILVDNQDKIIQTDHSTKGTQTISDYFLELTYVDSPVNNVLIQKHNEAMSERGSKGWELYSHRFSRTNLPVASSAALEQNVDFKQAQDKHIIDYVITVHDTADLSTSYAYDYDEDFKAVTSIGIKNGSNYLQKQSAFTDLEYDKYLLPQYKMQNVNFMKGIDIYHFYQGVNMSREFDDVNHFYGSDDTSKYSDLKGEITLASTSSAKTIKAIFVEAAQIAIVNGVLHWCNV